ncbi:MAG: chemotaxis protein CheW [Tissierella sp.]|uniref:chemotaxis protein CheW n=1 Tax=Tissierella sp. TaxID=41274 RepID=UPI003F996E74
MQIIIFTLNDKYYAINTKEVEEITKTISLTNVPNSEDWTEGLINLRGNVVTLINMNKLLLQEEDSCYNNIIIVENEEERIGILVKEVIEVVNIEEEKIENFNIDNDGILGIYRIENRVINIIDIDSLLYKNEG